MKRVLLLVLCLTMVFSLCACGEDSPSKKEDVKETKRVPKAVAVLVVSLFDVGDAGFGISSSELDVNQKLVEEYIGLLKSNRVMEAVAEKYAKRADVVPFTADYIRSLFAFDSVEESNLLEVTVMCPDGKRTEEELLWLCEDLLKVVPSIIEESMSDVVDIHILDLPAIEYVTVEV